MPHLEYYYFLIFFGSAVVGLIGLWLRQPLIVVYVVLGSLIGPYGFNLIHDIHVLEDLSEIGIIFLLFLLGLDLIPNSLFNVFARVTKVSIFGSLLFFSLGFGFAFVAQFNLLECLIIGIATLFSSTIIGIKLLPTTVLHHKITGEMIIGILLIQDFLAILALMSINILSDANIELFKVIAIIVGLPVLYFGCQLTVKYALNKIIAKYDHISEFIFVLAIGWCIGVSHISKMMGLSAETGAFIAGVTLAASPISKYLSLQLKPLRDFFLTIFFFTLGALFNFQLFTEIWLLVLLFTLLVIVSKPLAFRFLSFGQLGTKKMAWDLGFRLGQLSEFSLLICILAFQNQLISQHANTLIQATTILTILISSYVIVANLPNPIAFKKHLRRD